LLVAVAYDSEKAKRTRPKHSWKDGNTETALPQ
jgi:hypothetical protein